MTTVTPEEIKGVVKTVRNDWKSVVTLLMVALIFFGGTTWMITGYVVKGAQAELSRNTADISAIKAKGVLIDSEVFTMAKRQDETLQEIRSVKQKLDSVAESQARMEGVLLGAKK